MTNPDSVRPAHFGMTPEQRASFDLFGNPEYRPYWPDVKLTGPDGVKRSWTELTKEYRDADRSPALSQGGCDAQ